MMTTSETTPVISQTVIDRLNRETGLARGLPNAAFISQAFHELENTSLFPRTWSFIAPASDVPNPDDVKPVEVAGQSLFMVRDGNGEIGVFYNVCPHRGARLVTEPQQGTASLTCPYHAWSYKLDGKLNGRPHYHGPDQHDRSNEANSETVCLFKVRC